MKHIAFAPPRMDEAIIEEVTKVLRSGWITTGPVTKALEKEVAALSGVPKAFCVNSATAGLELMLRWLGVQEGDEVIVPAYTYCATANVVVHCGATPVMVDICEDTLTIDPAKVAAAIGPKTKAILPVDIGDCQRIIRNSGMWYKILKWWHNSRRNQRCKKIRSSDDFGGCSAFDWSSV